MESHQAALMRLKYKYRRLIMEGKLILPHEEAAKLLGPDCAYHLYSVSPSRTKKKKDPSKKRNPA